MSPARAPSARDRVRGELVGELKQIARRHVAEQGASSLSLRAVAREAGMVSSAVYRYFPSRDDLLTALIVDAYDAFGATVEAADAARRRADLPGRWLAICRAVRTWAVTNPHEWALLFGSPVPGYAAPVDTVDPAARAPLVALRLVADAASRGALAEDAHAVPAKLRADFAVLRTQIDAPQVTDSMFARALGAWAQLIGSVSLELFGHLHNVISDHPPFFDLQMRAVGNTLLREPDE